MSERIRVRDKWFGRWAEVVSHPCAERRAQGWGTTQRVARYALAICLGAGMAAQAGGQAGAQSTQNAQGKGEVLDRVVAVVNNQAILASDVDDEVRLAVLEPRESGAAQRTRPRALDELISRALIEQQMTREEAQDATPTQADVDARLALIRKDLPACANEKCSTGDGWKAFLAEHSLTAERVESYLRNRMLILRFIEQRFRQGIRNTQQEVETYYRNTLLPQFAAGTTAPPLEEIAPRIQEILLQQKVNVLFDEWLKNLRHQGEIEVLDPSLETPETQAAGMGGGVE